MTRRLLAAMAIILLVVSVTGCGGSKTDTNTKTQTTTADLKASVKLIGGTTMEITNNDTFEWTSVKFEVNGQGLKSGYTYNLASVKPGATVKAPLNQFTLGNGTRFNPVTTKPLNFSIWCKTSRGNGWWYGAW